MKHVFDSKADVIQYLLEVRDEYLYKKLNRSLNEFEISRDALVREDVLEILDEILGEIK